VGQELADGDRVLARGGELRPVGGDRGVEVELALAGQAGGAGGDQALAHREHVHQRVGLPAAALLLAGPAAVEVRDDVPVHHDADRRAELTAFGEVGAEGLAQRPEPRIAVVFYRGWHEHTLIEAREAWMPHPGRKNNMNEASTPYPLAQARATSMATGTGLLTMSLTGE
jgi:hypothetical protein